MRSPTMGASSASGRQTARLSGAFSNRASITPPDIFRSISASEDANEPYLFIDSYLLPLLVLVLSDRSAGILMVIPPTTGFRILRGEHTRRTKLTSFCTELPFTPTESETKTPSWLKPTCVRSGRYLSRG